MYSPISMANSAVVIIISFFIVASGSPVERSGIPVNITQSVQLVHNGTVVELNLTANEREALTEALIRLRLRQDEGDLENVAQIISGVLGGGLGNIFMGSSGFIGNSAVQEEVTFVLNNVSPVVDTVLKFSWDGLKQYFGIGVATTTQKPVVVVSQQPQLVNQTVQNNVQIPGGQSQLVFAPVAPVAVTPTSEDNDSDNDNEAAVAVAVL